MSGYNFNSRCGESINKNLNMRELIAKNDEEYISKAVDLSNEKEKYFNLRKSIFANAEKSPLFNGKKFAENFFNSLKEIIK